MSQSTRLIVAGTVCACVIAALVYGYGAVVHRAAPAGVAVAPSPLAVMPHRPQMSETTGVAAAGTMALELAGSAQPDASAAGTVPGAMPGGAGGTPRGSATRQREQALQTALAHMQAVMSSAQHDPAAFSEAIAEAEKANGSPVMSGLNLETLRHNIEVSAQIQQTLQQIQLLQDAQAAASQPDAQAQLHEKTRQLQELTHQLSANIMQVPPPAVTRAQ